LKKSLPNKSVEDSVIKGSIEVVVESMIEEKTDEFSSIKVSAFKSIDVLGVELSRVESSKFDVDEVEVTKL
jgi:hypothetical protein